MQEEKQSIDLRTVLAFVLLIGLAVLYPVYMKWVNPEPPADPTPIEYTTPETQPDTTRTAHAEPPAASVTPSEPAIDGHDTVPSAVLFENQDITERAVTVETDRYTVVLSTRGARPTRIALKDYVYNSGPREGQFIEMIPPDNGAVGPAITFFRDSLRLADVLFEPDRQSLTLSGQDSATVSFRATRPGGDAVVLSYTFHGDRHAYDLAVAIDNAPTLGIAKEYYVGWSGGLFPTEPDYEMDAAEFEAAAMMGRDLETIDDVDVDKPRTFLSGETHWAAVRTKYFLAAVIPRGRAGAGFVTSGTTRRLHYTDRGWSFSDLFGGGERYADSITVENFSASVRMDMPYGTRLEDRFTVVVGPIDYSALGDFNVGLEDLVDMGWTIIKPFSLAILWLFKALHGIFGNYGVVIILFAFLIKVVFHPLSRKQIRAMARMKDLQPRMQQLKEKYKGDPQRLNQETMKMYKEAGANPLAGCLPLLPQMPIFFALFTVFRSTIELRGAEFFYLADLSQKDPYYILPILMMVTMFLSQQFTQTAAAGGQQKMLQYMMPPFMAFIFRNFPGGLNLYWAMFNLFSFAETWWMKRHTTPES